MKLIGKLKICSFLLTLMFLVSLVAINFPMQKNCKQAVAYDAEMTEIAVNSYEGANRQANKCLTGDDGAFLSGYIYNVKNNDGKNRTISLKTQNFDLIKSKSLAIWIFIPTISFNNLEISINNSANLAKTTSWNYGGSDQTEIKYSKKLSNLIYDFENAQSKGWKLLNLSLSDADKNAGLETYNQINVHYGFDSNDLEDDANFAVAFAFLMNETSSKTRFIDRQNYYHYKEKENLQDTLFDKYVGDEISFSKNDIFKYFVAGKQNILEDATGFEWSVQITNPASSVSTQSFESKLNYSLLTKGYYLFDINLKTTGTLKSLVISESFNVYAENFSAGFFAKENYYLKQGTKNIVVFYQNNDFEIDGEIQILTSNNNVVDVTYYKEGQNINFVIDANEIGSENLKISFDGKRISTGQISNFEQEIEINVYDMAEKDYSSVFFVVAGVLFVVALVYVLILYIKAKKFDVK